MKISIVICSHDRSTDAGECLARLAERAPFPDIEILVVDSGSNREHAALIKKHAQATPSCRYIRVDHPGTSLARNTGLASAKGEWIWWLDDDAIPSSDWPEQLDDAICQADGDTAIIGGKVLPKFNDGAELGHLTDRWRLLLTCIEDDEPGFVSGGKNVASANMLMRRSVALQLGGFSERLGRAPGQLVTGEESLLIELMHDQGYKCAYRPALSVFHKVSSQRLTRKWVSERAYWEGHVKYRLLALRKQSLPWHLHPLKLQLSIYALSLLSWIRQSNADISIRRNLAQGSLDAIRGISDPSTCI